MSSTQSAPSAGVPGETVLCRYACILGYKRLHTFPSAAQQPPSEIPVTLPPPPSQPQPPQPQPQAAAMGKVIVTGVCIVVWMTSDLSVKSYLIAKIVARSFITRS